jgi:hypothetical protein
VRRSAAATDVARDTEADAAGDASVLTRVRACRSAAATDVARELEERARGATAAAEAAARGAAEADARVEEVKKALRAEAGGPGGSLAGGALQARGPARSRFPPPARPARRRAHWLHRQAAGTIKYIREKVSISQPAK